MKSTRRDERGFGHAVTIVLAVIVIAAIAAIGWQVTKKNKTTPAATNTSTTAAVTNSAEASCNKVYHDTNLCKFAANSADFAKTAYTAVDTSVDAQGQTSSITIKSDGKGNTALTSTAAGQSFDSIEIGTTVYTKDPASNTWTKYTSNAPAVSNPASDIKTNFSTSTTPAAQQIQYKNLGKTACGKLTCFKYQIIDPANAGTTQYAWFDTNSYRLQEYSSKGSDGSTNTFVITYGAVSITAPSPVTDASAAASSGTGASSSTPTAAQVQAAEQQAAAAAASAQSGQ